MVKQQPVRFPEFTDTKKVLLKEGNLLEVRYRQWFCLHHDLLHAIFQTGK